MVVLGGRRFLIPPRGIGCAQEPNSTRTESAVGGQEWVKVHTIDVLYM